MDLQVGFSTVQASGFRDDLVFTFKPWLYELLSKLLVSPLITLIVVPSIIPISPL